MYFVNHENSKNPNKNIENEHEMPGFADRTAVYPTNKRFLRILAVDPFSLLLTPFYLETKRTMSNLIEKQGNFTKHPKSDLRIEVL